MSVVSRVMVEMGHALSDACGHLLHGDDAGKSAKLIFVARPRGTEGKYALGLTFLEVNGRAYVKSVHPHSEAAVAGVQIRDAVQFVAVLGGNLATLANDESRAASYALECEKAGMRTNYEELRGVFEYNCLLLPDHPDNSSNTGAALDANSNPGTPTRAPTDKNRTDPGTPGTTDSSNSQLFDEPSTRRSPARIVQNTMRSATQAAVGKCGPNASSLVLEDDDDVNGSIILNNNHNADFSQTRGGSKSHATGGTGNVDNRGPSTPCDPVTGEVIHPVIMVFRRTRKRQTLGGMPHIGLPAFRIDDECDRAARLVRRLAPTADTAPQPDAWDEIVHDTTDWLLPTGSILPPHDLALLTATANTHLGGEIAPPALDPPAGGGSRSPKTSPTAADTAPPPPDITAPLPTPDDTIPLDPLEAKSSEKLSQVRSRMYAEAIRAGTAGHRGGSDDIEASTIRGMIQNAVGLAFVRTSKVVLGVSMHGGSGIVIARLSDGTWSAPSAIGTWGLGFGIQFGLEVADYIFILQTEDSLQHFRRGGNFTIGGNVGAAFAGLGREAYGAASVGMLCGSPNNAINTSVPAESGSSKRGASSPVACDPASAAFIADTATAAMGGKPTKAARKATLDSDFEGDDTDDDNHNATKRHRKSSSKLESGDGTAEIAPIVAYAKSQGLYFGVSLEGSRIFTRDDINSRTYKFQMGREVTAREILTGQVPTPPEAEDLYASLHSVEFTHEMASLPRPPEVLRADSQHAWRYDQSTLGKPKMDANGDGDASLGSTESPKHTSKYSFLDNLTDEEAEECAAFETKFKKFMYGGVSVQRVAIPDSDEPATNKTRKERRTLWLMLPEVGALRLGFISKLNDNTPGDVATSGAASPTNRSILRDVKGARSSLSKRVGFDLEEDDYSRQTEDQTTIMSEEGTYDDTVETNTQGSAMDGTRGASSPNNRLFKRKNGPLIRAGNVQLSSKYSVALTDVTVLSQEPNVVIRFNPDDATEHLRLISIQDASGTSLLFLANSFREAELLVCGLKLLLERETTRLGVRGGVSLVQLGGVPPARGAMSPEAARGYRGNSGSVVDGTASRGSGGQSRVSAESSDDGESFRTGGETSGSRQAAVPEGRRSWSQVPGRSYLREMASRSQSLDEDNNETKNNNNNNDSKERKRSTPGKDDAARDKGGKNSDEKKVNVPTYVHGQLLIRDIATNVTLPLPLPLCRVLLLDSSSPVIAKWEADRGDMNYSKSQWTFPPATPRELERHASEHQLIASGSMMGAHRTTSYDRVRHGDIVHLSETQIVDADDTEKLAFTVSERLPRRGFAVKVRILLRAVAPHSCDATILGEVRPLGKNMSNQLAVHKAFLLVISEIKMRYGTEGKGLLAGFLNVVNNLPDPGSPYAPPTNGADQRAPAPTPAPTLPPQTSGKSQNSPKNRINGHRHQSATNSSDRGLQNPRNQTRSRSVDPPEKGGTTNNLPSSQDPVANGSNAGKGSGSDRARKETIQKNGIVKDTAQRKVSTGTAGRRRGIDEEHDEEDRTGARIGMAPRPQDPNVFDAFFQDVVEQRKTPTASRNPVPTPRDLGAERPPTPSAINSDQAYENTEPPKNFTASNVFAEMPNDEYEDTVKKPVTIEVKPLPKIRLSLMPSPREEDEENASSSSPSLSPKKSTRPKKNGTTPSGTVRENRRRRSNRHSV